MPTVAATPVPDPAAFGPRAAGSPAQAADPTTLQNRQDQKEAFLKSGSTETRNSGSLELPVSPYQVMAGTVIAGALVTGIKSDLPGDVIGTVTEPVYDTATGRHLLIPQGSRLLGKDNSQVSYGQRRMQMVWSRIILPDTSSLTLDRSLPLRSRRLEGELLAGFPAGGSPCARVASPSRRSCRS